MNYYAFLFRNDKRTVFGIREVLERGPFLSLDVCKKWAHKVVTDERFRCCLISTDPDLPLTWKAH